MSFWEDEIKRLGLQAETAEKMDELEAFARTGDRANVLQYIQDMASIDPAGPAVTVGLMYSVISAHVKVGNTSDACYWLEQAIENDVEPNWDIAVEIMRAQIRSEDREGVEQVLAVMKKVLGPGHGQPTPGAFLAALDALDEPRRGQWDGCSVHNAMVYWSLFLSYDLKPDLQSFEKLFKICQKKQNAQQAEYW